jgi:hypothetical protein
MIQKTDEKGSEKETRDDVEATSHNKQTGRAEPVFRVYGERGMDIPTRYVAS